MDDNGNVHSARISDELFWMFEGADLKGQKLLWNDVEEMPALIELAASGDQRVYLYMGEKYNEEYPIARFDNEPCVWLTEASLLNHLLSCFDRDELSKDQKIAGFFNKDTQAELTEAQKRNEAFTKKEWWHKKLQWPG